jgi:hypothetical protein
MPAKKRPRRERTDDWQKIQHYTLWPEQKVYELLRPVVLFNESATERARETGEAERSVRRSASQFEKHGMASLFPQTSKEEGHDKSRSLPPDMRQLIVDRHPLSTLTFAPMKWQRFAFSALAEDPLLTLYSAYLPMARLLLFLRVGFPLTHKLLSRLSVEKS